MNTIAIQGQVEPLTVGKIICVGRNYADHAREMKVALPSSPVLFLKPPSAIIHDNDSIVIPSISSDIHHEVEMIVVMGEGGKSIPENEALSHVAGYGVGLDMTLRDVQAEAKKQGLPWTLAKGFDTSAPVSSVIPASLVPDPHELGVELKVNGTVRQQGQTRNFLFPVEKLIAYISRFFTLEPGDLIFTGTPEGVGRVVAGDVLHAELSGPDAKALASITVRVA